MAEVTCSECGLKYDDVYRWTYCPHDTFEMRTMATRNGVTKLCTSVEELDEFMGSTDG